MNKSDKEEVFHKTSINWYPGHMVKAKNDIKKDLKLIDIVLEVLDARIPISSHNPDIDEIINEKKKIVLLNKSDLSDELENKKWIDEFKRQGTQAILTDLNTGSGVKSCLKQIEALVQKDEKTKNVIRVLVVGIPNVGKSSFINAITKKKSLNVKNIPGVTKQNQWVKLNSNIYLLDTPGVLWPKFDSEEISLNLAFTGTIKDDVLDKVEVAYKLLEILKLKYPVYLKERYKLEIEDISLDTVKLMLLIGQKRGALVSGGNVDEKKTANILLEDFRSGKIGRITLEINS